MATKSAEDRPVPPLALMGTSAFAPSLAMVMEIGCGDLLQKPVTRSTLRLLLNRLTSGSPNPMASFTLPDALQSLEGCHLLYAEDSLPSQKIVKRMLEKAGAKCTVVENGKLAVEAALEENAAFDCILMVGLRLVKLV